MIFVVVAVLVSTALGVYARQRFGERAERTTARGIDAFVWLVLPPLTYFLMARVEFSSGVGFGLVVTFVVLAVVALIAYLVADRVMGLERPAVGSTINGSLLANTGYLGVPLSAAVLGHEAIGAAVTYDVIVTGTVTWTAGTAIGAAFGTRSGEGAGGRARAFVIRNPVFYAALLGLVAPDALAPQEAADVSQTIFALILPIGFFMLGVYLMGEREDGTLQWPPPITRPIGLVIALRLGIAPLLLLASSRIADVPDAYLLQAAMPSGLLSVMIAHLHGLDVRLAANAVAWTTTIVMIASLGAVVVT